MNERILPATSTFTEDVLQCPDHVPFRTRIALLIRYCVTVKTLPDNFQLKGA